MAVHWLVEREGRSIGGRSSTDTGRFTGGAQSYRPEAQRVAEVFNRTEALAGRQTLGPETDT